MLPVVIHSCRQSPTFGTLGILTLSRVRVVPLRRDDVHVIIKTSIRQYMHIVPISVSCVCAPHSVKSTQLKLVLEMSCGFLSLSFFKLF